MVRKKGGPHKMPHPPLKPWPMPPPPKPLKCEYCSRPISFHKNCQGCGAPIPQPMLDAVTIRLQRGIMSVNEVRRLEGLDDIT